MNCRNCGAPMELFARRRYYFCAYCSTFEFIETDALDRLRILSETDPPMPCPVCSERLGHALMGHGHRVLHCKKCRGILMQRSVFSDEVSRRRASATGPGTIPSPLDRRELRRVVTCPLCRKKMDVHPYYGPGGIVIDTCSRCDAVWLDSGELGQITDAPGSDRGQ